MVVRESSTVARCRRSEWVERVESPLVPAAIWGLKPCAPMLLSHLWYRWT